MRRWLPILVCAACSGPRAPDAAVCEDFVHRLCLAPVCDVVTQGLAPVGDCEQDLLARSGCASPDFAFTQPTRDRFLSCRLPLLRAGGAPEDHPNCDDVQDVFNTCPDVIAMFQGGSDGGP